MSKESNLEKSPGNNFDDSQGRIGIHHGTLFLFWNPAVCSYGCSILLACADGELRLLVRTHWLRKVARSL